MDLPRTVLWAISFTVNIRSLLNGNCTLLQVNKPPHSQSLKAGRGSSPLEVSTILSEKCEEMAQELFISNGC